MLGERLSSERFHFGFDWAEDVEDELQAQQPSGFNGDETLARPQSAWEAEGGCSEADPMQSEDCQDDEVSFEDECGDSTYGTCENSSQYESMETVTPLTFEEDVNDQVLVNIPLTEEVTSEDWMQQGITAEFRGREYVTSVDSRVHHFNWFGHPVYQPSATTPAECLGVIRCGPKVPKESDSLRVESILQRAFQFLDPIVVSLKERPHPNPEHRGPSLPDTTEDHVSKFYTPHGLWISDWSHSASSEVISLDSGSKVVYQNPNLSVGNGFVESSVLLSRVEWSTIYQEKQASLRCFPDLRKDQRSKLPPSRLRLTTLTCEDEVILPGSPLVSDLQPFMRTDHEESPVSEPRLSSGLWQPIQSTDHGGKVSGIDTPHGLWQRPSHLQTKQAKTPASTSPPSPDPPHTLTQQKENSCTPEEEVCSQEIGQTMPEVENTATENPPCPSTTHSRRRWIKTKLLPVFEPLNDPTGTCSEDYDPGSAAVHLQKPRKRRTKVFKAVGNVLRSACKLIPLHE
ncbi:hypothetical protein PDE_07584 [Penicillium oxalicum 114-2]|uniref:Uncharacterized protein n=1 Tax=Penicillium oxalicum (strain 114-2 / CGMCC 5302) TaxID=933388 RepID=S7ZQC7_PENO1|nr:hypothetical protein PDE_07584 [Penicillium oxalicum 114-2]